MATEDLTTYTESDPSSVLTVTPDRASVSSLGETEFHLTRDCGADHFDGDFEHRFKYLYSAQSGSAKWVPWQLSNTADSNKDIQDASGDALSAWGLVNLIRILEVVSGSASYSDSDALSADTVYYLRIKRDETVGTYGTLYCYIATGGYDDDGGSLFDTVTLTLGEKEDFRYVGIVSREAGFGGGTISGYMEDLDLGEAAAATGVALTPVCVIG